MNYEQLFFDNICEFEKNADENPITPQHNRYRMLKQGIEKKWIKTTTPIRVSNYIFVPWKIVDDSLYTSSNALWFEENLPRSLVSVHHADTLELKRLAYGLNKFGSIDESSMGSNIQINQLINLDIPVEFSVSQKHNGEAATIWGIDLDGEFYYVIMSKSVPAVVKTRAELDEFYQSTRFKTCREIGIQFFDLVDSMSKSDIKSLQCILLDHIFPIEKVDRKFKHIACEPPGLYILSVRNSHNLNILNAQESKIVLDKMIVWGFFESKKFTQEEILRRIQTVKTVYESLPYTPDKPSLKAFDSWNTPANFLKVWSYVSLIYEQVVCPEISYQEILSIGAGIPHEKFNLTEGTIITVRTPRFINKVYMVKDKDLLYYLLRGIRTVIESYKTRPYRGASINSKSLKHWVNYLTPVWRSAWDDFVSKIEKYMCASNSIQTLKDNYEKSATGGIDAPDFFAGVLKWLQEEKFETNFRPILILTTELEVEIVRPFITSPEYSFVKVPKKGEIPNNIVGMIHGVRVGALESLKADVSIIRFSELVLEAVKDDKKTKALLTNLLDDIYVDIPLCVCVGDLQIAISRLMTKEEETKSTFLSVFKVRYFDSSFYPKVETSTLNFYSKLMDMMTRINLSAGKFENNSSTEQSDFSKVCLKYINNQIIPRNSQASDLIAQNIIEVYQNLTKNPKLAVFITGIPGLGKDYIANQIQTNLENRLSELKNRIQVINQDMFQCDATKYAQGLTSCVKTKSLVIITRNGPGSQKSLDICKEAGFSIHLVAPCDAQVLLLSGAILSSLKRSHEDLSKSHVLSLLPDEKIVSICSNFFGVLSSANTMIASASIDTNTKTYSQFEFLAIAIGSKHLTLEYGLITNRHLIGLEVQVNSVKTVCIQKENYEIEFELCELSDCCSIVDSQVPHITNSYSGFAKPVHSGWWGWIVQKLFADQVGRFMFGLWAIEISPCEKLQKGVIGVF